MKEKNMDHYNDEIDLVQLIKVLIKRKWLIVIGTLLVTLAALIVSMMLPKVYKSDGFFQLSTGIDVNLAELIDIQEALKTESQIEPLDMTLLKDIVMNDFITGSSLTVKSLLIPDYKKYFSQFTNPQRFLGFLDRQKQIQEKPADNNQILDELRESIRAAEDIATWIEPVYAYTRKDSKELVQISRDAKNFVLGVRIHGEQQTPRKAQSFVSIIGTFIKDSILYGKLKDYIISEFNKSQTESKKYENFIIQNEFKLKQLTEKHSDIKEVLKRYPEVRTMNQRELVTLGNTGHRFLSPTIQLVGIESYMADVKEYLSTGQREKQLADLKLEFFAKTKEIMDKETFGDPLLSKSVQLMDSFPAKKDLPDDIIREVKNNLAVDFGNLLKFKEGMQFIAGPAFLEKPIRPRKAVIIATALLVGFFLFIFLAFFIEWWNKNKKKIVD